MCGADCSAVVQKYLAFTLETVVVCQLQLPAVLTDGGGTVAAVVGDIALCCRHHSRIGIDAADSVWLRGIVVVVIRADFRVARNVAAAVVVKIIRYAIIDRVLCQPAEVIVYIVFVLACL